MPPLLKKGAYSNAVSTETAYWLIFKITENYWLIVKASETAFWIFSISTGVYWITSKTLIKNCNYYYVFKPHLIHYRMGGSVNCNLVNTIYGQLILQFIKLICIFREFCGHYYSDTKLLIVFLIIIWCLSVDYIYKVYLFQYAFLF